MFRGRRVAPARGDSHELPLDHGRRISLHDAI